MESISYFIHRRRRGCEDESVNGKRLAKHVPKPFGHAWLKVKHAAVLEISELRIGDAIEHRNMFRHIPLLQEVADHSERRGEFLSVVRPTPSVHDGMRAFYLAVPGDVEESRLSRNIGKIAVLCDKSDVDGHISAEFRTDTVGFVSLAENLSKGRAHNWQIGIAKELAINQKPRRVLREMHELAYGDLAKQN